MKWMFFVSFDVVSSQSSERMNVNWMRLEKICFELFFKNVIFGWITSYLRKIPCLAHWSLHVFEQYLFLTNHFQHASVLPWGHIFRQAWYELVPNSAGGGYMVGKLMEISYLAGNEDKIHVAQTLSTLIYQVPFCKTLSQNIKKLIHWVFVKVAGSGKAIYAAIPR